MQQKANEVHLYLEGKSILLKDVKIIETEDGIYVEDAFKLGTSEDGKDLMQKRLTYYRRESLSKILWQEDNLVESVKEAVLSELIQDKFEHLMDMYEEEEEEETPQLSGREKRDDPNFDPYGKKED
jgi:DNA-binding cell septation regulator SpoVG